MSTIFKPKRSNTPESVPTTVDLADGELAVNSADKKIYLRSGSNIIAISNYSEPSFEPYELDDISLLSDGIANTFPLTLNYVPVNIANPYNILVFVNGIIQSAFINTTEDSFVLGSKNGYTIDSDGNIKFSESLPQGTNVIIKVISESTTSTKVRYYPFSPTNILLNS